MRGGQLEGEAVALGVAPAQEEEAFRTAEGLHLLGQVGGQSFGFAAFAFFLFRSGGRAYAVECGGTAEHGGFRAFLLFAHGRAAGFQMLEAAASTPSLMEHVHHVLTHGELLV